MTLSKIEQNMPNRSTAHAQSGLFRAHRDGTVLARLRNYLAKTLSILQSEQVVVYMYGGELSREIYRIFTSRHPKFPLLPKKYFGSALLRLPQSPDDYLKGAYYETVRRKCRQAKQCGYSFDVVRALDFIDDIVAVNHSQPMRQGRPMQSDYLDEEAVRSFCVRSGEVFAVLNRERRLVAYAHAPLCGDVFIFSRLLGHAALLKYGIMYLLVSETVKAMIRVYQQKGYPLWAQYDMFLGAKPGLAQFKRSLGFRPYRVIWRWRQGID